MAAVKKQTAIAVAPRKSAEKWVNAKPAPATKDEGIKRLTLDLPASLHRAIKMSCADRGVTMLDDIKDMLEKHYL